MPARFLFLDEVDAYPGDIEGEGDPIALNQPLVLTKPTVPMRLVSDDEAANPTRPGRFTAITIRLEEAL
jgi:phage terminase large subunit GpA-like protein